MTIKIYYTTVTGSREVKTHQNAVTQALDSKGIKYELVDISQDSSLRDDMRSKCGKPTAMPPQIFNEEQYCGDYTQFAEAVEDDAVEQFLKLA
ncbi:SH3 domain-binding glutamic acid-rich-like protein 3 [Protopterus annectens]|uniref:SH3 domain-binding glutamic acid-rich-like protein 3 n=1 Tax=Protopterus annectens TaxID=7888 RepID=UPI001CFADB2D|nr:SH3 domain-binding glutamic acid-rich-like protein 3 [Protopterus annectens]